MPHMSTIAPERLKASIDVALKVANPPAIRNLREQRARARETAAAAREELRALLAAMPAGDVPTGPAADRIRQATKMVRDAEERAQAARAELIAKTQAHGATVCEALTPATVAAIAEAQALLDAAESLLAPLDQATATLRDSNYELPASLFRAGPAIAALRGVRRALAG
jgi:hypothetical protein